MLQPLPTCTSCEYVNWQLEQAALRNLVIRRLAALVHKDHFRHITIPWHQCQHHDCLMAQRAVNGKLRSAEDLPKDPRDSEERSA